jgi:uncharacterized membrane protein YdbT with pleckstrin-like domain
MGFPRRFLHETEEIVVERRPHLWFFARPIAAFVVSLAAWIALSSAWGPKGTANDVLNWVGRIAVLVSVLWFGGKYLQWFTTYFVVTTDRLIHKSGVISRRGKEIPLERINDIASNQSIFERMIGAGDLLIESGGEQGQQRFSDIRRPFDVQNIIYQQMERTHARDMDRMAGRRELSIPEQLEKLHELAQRGVISPAEFEAKKAQLLEKM